MATATPREGKLTDSDYDARNSTLAQSMRRTCSRSVVVVLPITVGIAVAVAITIAVAITVAVVVAPIKRQGKNEYCIPCAMLQQKK